MISEVSTPCLPATQAAQLRNSEARPLGRVTVLEAVCVSSLIALTVFSAVVTALVRPLWYDEIGTATVSGLHSFSQIWSALLKAADAQPPTFFWVTGMSRQAFSSPELGLRFPAVLSFGVLAVCLYVVTRRVWNWTAALVALLVLMCSQGLYYASEARPYGALLGCLGVAALLWQNRKHGNCSVVNLIGCLAALTGICALHYYGLFVVAVFGLVEIAIAVTSRKPDWSFLLGLPFCAAPIVWAKPLVDASRHQIAAGFWARPSIKAIAEGYVFSFGNVPLNDWTLLRLHSGRLIGAGDVLPLVVMTGAIFFCFLATRRIHRSFVQVVFNGPPELLLALGLLLLPAIAGVTAMIALGGYTPRYTIGAVWGSAILTAWIATRLGVRATVIVAAALTLLFTGVQSHKDIDNLRGYLKGDTAAVVAQRHFAPVYDVVSTGKTLIIADGHLFFESWCYSRPDYRSRLIYLQDRQLAMRFSGSDSYDVVNERLKPYMSLHLEDANSFLRDHTEFLIAQRGQLQSWNWLMTYLASRGAHYRQIATGDQELSINLATLPIPGAVERVSKN